MNVKETLTKAANYLVSKVTSKKSKLNNAFFSGSVKIIYKNLPTFYPANRIFDKNNKPVNAQTAKFNDIDNLGEDSMKGFIEDE